MKKLFLGAMALLAAVTLVACGSKKDAYESIKENKKLVVAVSPDYAPFEFKTLVDGKDQVVGSDIKLAQAIADELGVKLEVTTMSFDNVLSSLQSGKADLAISGISVTDERKKTFDFSYPYYETQNAIIVRKDQESTYSSLDAFKGKKVAVQKGTIEEGLAKKQLKDSTVVSLTAMGEAINEVKSGQVDAVDLEKPVAEGYVAQNQIWLWQALPSKLMMAMQKQSLWQRQRKIERSSQQSRQEIESRWYLRRVHQGCF